MIYAVSANINFDDPILLKIDLNYLLYFLELIEEEDGLNKYNVFAFNVSEVRPGSDGSLYSIFPYSFFRNCLIKKRVIDLPEAYKKDGIFENDMLKEQLRYFKDAIPIFDKHADNNTDILVLFAQSY